jgi:hypothetical protein
MSIPPANPKLDYAPPPKWHRRRWFRFVHWALVALLLAAAVRYGPQGFHRIRTTWTARACLGYTEPAGQLVCAEPLPWAGETPPFSFAAPEPNCVGNLRPLLGQVDSTEGPVLFAHEMQTPSCLRRLVILRRTPPGKRSSWDLPLSFSATVIDPALLGGKEPRVMSLNEVVPDAFGDGTSTEPPLRFYAGQPDLANAAHFTINYDLRGKSGTIDGWLIDPMAEVKLTARYGNAPMPPGQ